jgi:hypothetical protein
MQDPTPKQIAATERAMDQLDTLADGWAVGVDLPSLIKGARSPMGLKRSAPVHVRQRFRADAIVYQAFIAAYMRAVDYVLPNERETSE